MWYKGKEYYSVNKWVGIFNRDYKDKGIKVNAHDIHQLFGYYKIPKLKINGNGEIVENGRRVLYPVNLVNQVRTMKEDFMYVLSNITEYGVSNGKEFYIPYNEKEITEPTYKNDENDMEKYSNNLEKQYQLENKKTIKLTESQYKRLFENFENEGFRYNGKVKNPYSKSFLNNNNNIINIDWDEQKNNIGKVKDKDDTTKYNNIDDVNDEKDLTMHPTVVKLPRSKIDCYNLYNMNTKELQQAIKHKRWGTNGARVKWNRDNFINKSVEYAQDLIKNIIQRLNYNAMKFGEEENIEIGYITFPSSSSVFNTFFVKKLKKYFPNVEVVNDFFLKRRSGIGIDYEMAKMLNCDALDVAKLEGFVADADAKEKTIDLRQKVENLIDKVSENINSNIYNFTSKNDYIDLVNSNDAVAISKNNKKIKTEELSDNDYNIIMELTNLMLKINREYNSLENVYKEIEERRKENVKNRKYANLEHDNETFSKLHRTKANNTLDKTLNDRNPWQIKKQGEYARKILRNLFMVDDNKWMKMEKDKDSKVVVIFDDNMAGGATMDNVCYALLERNWKYVIPLTLATMPITTGTDITSASKQRDRDKLTKQLYGGDTLLNNIKNNRVEKRFSYDLNDGETIHNINKIMYDKEYDYDNVSTYNKTPSTNTKNIVANLKPSLQKPQKIKSYRGRKPSGNFIFNGKSYSSDGINSVENAETFIKKTFPNSRVINDKLKLRRYAEKIFNLASEARKKYNDFLSY